MLTYNQTLHREYLKSPVWQAKRVEALSHYGSICNRCKEYGNDVHHKTYERWGGNELMQDLEVLCRGCHEAHHRVERANRERRSNLRSIRKQAIFGYLSRSQKNQLVRQHSLFSEAELSAALMSERLPLMMDAARLLGCTHVSGTKLGRTAFLERRKAKEAIETLAKKKLQRQQKRSEDGRKRKAASSIGPWLPKTWEYKHFQHLRSLSDKLTGPG